MTGFAGCLLQENVFELVYRDKGSNQILVLALNSKVLVLVGESTCKLRNSELIIPLKSENRNRCRLPCCCGELCEVNLAAQDLQHSSTRNVRLKEAHPISTRQFTSTKLQTLGIFGPNKY